jgi:hypothetical protein
MVEPPTSRSSVEGPWTLKRALEGSKAPKQILDRQALVKVSYVGFDGLTRDGYLVVDRSLAKEVKSIFQDIYNARFPIHSIEPIQAYGWDDNASTTANNTSGFNYRTISGSKRLSKHAYGRAIDINPWQNPWLSPKAVPGTQGFYVPSAKGTIVRGGAVEKAFRNRGWKWGGNWKTRDYQHFEK